MAIEQHKARRQGSQDRVGIETPTLVHQTVDRIRHRPPAGGPKDVPDRRDDFELAVAKRCGLVLHGSARYVSQGSVEASRSIQSRSPCTLVSKSCDTGRT